MKFNHLLCAGTILLAFSACSKDAVENTPNGGNENGEGAYMSLSISLPNAPGTRADDKTEAGTYDEQKVNKLLVLVYDSGATDGPIAAEIFDEKQLRPDNPNPVGTGRITTYTTPALNVITEGEKKVVVIVNPNSEFTKTSTLEDMRTAMTLTKDEVTKISSKDGEGGATGFLMTNANTAVNQNADGEDNTITPTPENPFNADGSVAVNVTGTKTNPTPVTIPVERAVAKITDVSGEYTKTVTGGTDKVTFTAVALVNGNTRFFPIKKIRASGEPGNDYVVDPNFTNSEVLPTDFYFKAFSGESADITDTDWKTLNSETPVADREAFYTLENTMNRTDQYTGYTTGLYYKATYYKGGEIKETPDNLYKFAGVLYTFTELEAAAAGLGLALDNLNDGSDASAFEAKGITKYTNGVCYYPYWIRHIPSDNTLGVMEFGVVRNNVYKMTINSVKGIGTPEPINPDPSTPDESSDAMLEVLVQVLPWTVRNNNIDF